MNTIKYVSQQASRMMRLVSLLVVAVSMATACGSTSATSGGSATSTPSGGSVIAIRARFQQIETHPCGSKPENAYVADDISGSGRAADLQEQRIAITDSEARRLAYCGGHLRVVAFSGNESDVTSMYDADLPRPSGTNTARMIAADKEVGIVDKTLTLALPTAYSSVTPTGTDVLSEYDLAKEYQDQLDNGGFLHLIILTDGINTAGKTNLERSLSPMLASQLADAAVVPTLAGARITVIGIGRTNEQAAVPSSYAEALKTFYGEVCKRTTATCDAPVTDYAN